jgi:RimJ/RimL family protein N-acetyltransferase
VVGVSGLAIPAKALEEGARTMLVEQQPETLREQCIPVLETERLVLRAPRLEDAKTVAALANDRRIAENTARIPHPYKLADAKDWISAGTRVGEQTFVITLASGAIIGACGLEMRDGPVPEIGYWLGVPHWGSGYATEAVRALIDHAFTDLDLPALQAGARVTNPASRRLLQKCGFQWTGVGLCRIRALSSSAPIDRFRLERDIWASLKRWGKMRRVA